MGKILGIESSCDETAAAVVENGQILHSFVVNSQIDIHKQYGGVVPEIAARSHIEVIQPVIDEALARAGTTWDEIDAIAVTYAPGLIGSLLVGTLAARGLALIHNKPLYPIHHVEAHVYANFITASGHDQTLARLNFPTTPPTFPLLALIVSGGHSQLALFENHGQYRLLGQTRDDAVGEAFDKVAKIIGLPYPGGPSIARAAQNGDATRFNLPKARLGAESFDFSFSGLKTAVLRAVQSEVGVDIRFPSHQLPALVSPELQRDMAASFQKIAIETLVDKTVRAAREFQPASVVIAGGVAANQELRRQLAARLDQSISYAPAELCTDNAAMIAALGHFHTLYGQPVSPYNFDVLPGLSMTDSNWRAS